MPDQDYSSAVEEARDIEKSAQPYTAYKGKIGLEKAIDWHPKEIADYTFTDLINLYERSEKIIKSTGLGLSGAAPPVAPAVKKEIAARTEEVESKVKEITSEALTTAKEISKEMEKPIEKKPEEAKPEETRSFDEIELERLAPEPIELEKEERKQEEISFEREERKPEEEIEIPEKPGIEIEKEEEKEEEKPKEIGIEKEEMPEKKIEMPPEAKPKLPEKKAPLPEMPIERPAAAVPPVLRERAEEAASKKFEEIEKQIMATLGGEVDEPSLKKKMLELTKELFKEKSINRREQIKLEITVLKDMLAKKVKAPKKGVGEKEAKNRILDTLVSTQKTELASIKDRLLTNYKNQVDTLRDKFQDNLGELPESDTAGRKSAFEKFVFDLTAISEQLPGSVSKYHDFLKEKHESEIRKFNSSLGKGDEALLKLSEARMKQVDDEYAREFASVRNIVKKSMDAIIEMSGQMVFGVERVPPKEVKVSEIVNEINEMDEGTLLYYLHTKDPESYKRYERKHLSKQEAIFKAKAMLASEKGLSDDMVKKYFSETEG